MKVGDTFVLGDVEYKVAEKKDEGGFGAVFKAITTSSPFESVAVKVLLPEIAQDPTHQARFKREARILANIEHPNVVKIRQTIEAPDGSIAIIQDFIQGAKPLDDVFCDLQPAEQLSIVLQVLYGLRATHGIGFATGAIHRDLSPSNVLIDENGHAKVIDFGLARSNPRDTAVITKNYSFGTEGCVSPEQFHDAANVDHRADLYALGRTITACIQKRSPRFADCARLAEPWKTFCEKLTEHDAALRHQNCVEAIEHLLELFPASDLLPAHAMVHFKEFSDGNWSGELPAQWPSVARRVWADFEGSPHEHYAILRLIKHDTFSHPDFELEFFFDYCEGYVIEPIFGSGNASFSSTDVLGDLLMQWMPHLDEPQRAKAFRRLVTTAKTYNRFHVMGLVRRAFQQTRGYDDLRGVYLTILNEEDPHRIIEGREIIPGR